MPYLNNTQPHTHCYQRLAATMCTLTNDTIITRELLPSDDHKIKHQEVCRLFMMKPVAMIDGCCAHSILYSSTNGSYGCASTVCATNLLPLQEQVVPTAVLRALGQNHGLAATKPFRT
jgi:hypothetical protein